ncbi:MAG: hypothetical protein II507_10960 [Treponema sp.]|nr:hypothetical protein [Treponema sp.]
MLLFLHYKSFYKASLYSLMNAIRSCTSTPSCKMPAALFCGNVYQTEFKVQLSDTLRVALGLRRIQLNSVLKAKLSKCGDCTQVDIKIRPEMLELILAASFFIIFFVDAIVHCVRENDFVPMIGFPVICLIPFLMGYIPYRMESQKLLDKVEAILEKAASKEGMEKNNGS